MSTRYPAHGDECQLGLGMSETEHRLASRNVGAAAPRSSPSLNVAKPIYEVLQATCTHQRQDLSKVLSKSTPRQAVPVCTIVREVVNGKRNGRAKAPHERLAALPNPRHLCPSSSGPFATAARRSGILRSTPPLHQMVGQDSLHSRRQCRAPLGGLWRRTRHPDIPWSPVPKCEAPGAPISMEEHTSMAPRSRKVRILLFKNLPPFRHNPGLQIPRLRYSPGLAPTTRLNALLNAASDS
jgi:hypothetical protein